MLKTHFYRNFSLLALLIALAAGAPKRAEAQEGTLNTAPPAKATPEQIIQQFADKENEVRQAWDRYVYREDIRLQELDGDTPTGEFHLVYDVIFNEQGKRVQSVVFAPQPSLQKLGMTQEDYDDLANGMPFSLTREELPKYQVMYVGQQKEDELNTYVFDVAPKQIVKGQRYFQGRIWVDDKDLEIVMSRGKMVPETRDPKGKKQENLFPAFTTYREQVDGHYWFPTYTHADDTLHFSNSLDVHMKVTIRYTNYRRFGSDVKIEYGGKEVQKDPNAKQKPPQP